MSIKVVKGARCVVPGFLSLEYRIRERTGVELAYNLVNVDGEDKGSDDAADLEYDGLLLFLFYNFR